MPGHDTKTTAESISCKKLSASANVEEKIARIKKFDPLIHAFIETYFDDAIKQAEQIDARIKAGKQVGALAGLVLAVKNVIAVKDRRMTCGSRLLRDYVVPYDATVVERIRQADGIIIGSLNCDEFACGTDTTKSAFFATVNPLSFMDESGELGAAAPQGLYVPGGSSGGSAAVIAAGFCDLALATDTGGSVRCPAAFCGVTGFKPTYGTVSRYGMADMAMSFEQISPIAPDAYGCALLLSVISGNDPKDSTTADTPHTASPDAAFGKERKLRIGIPEEFFEGADPAVAKVVKEAISRAQRECGFETVEISIPAVKYGIPAYYLLVYSEFASAMQKYDGLKYGAGADISSDLQTAASAARSENIGRECQRRIVLGTYITTKEHKDAWYTKALKARAFVREQFDKALEKCDFIAGPTMPMTAWKIGEMNSDPLQQYLADVLTVPANLCGLPAGSVMAGKVGRLAVGLQLIGRRESDYALLSLMGCVENALGQQGGAQTRKPGAGSK